MSRTYETMMEQLSKGYCNPDKYCVINGAKVPWTKKYAIQKTTEIERLKAKNNELIGGSVVEEKK